LFYAGRSRIPSGKTIKKKKKKGYRKRSTKKDQSTLPKKDLLEGGGKIRCMTKKRGGTRTPLRPVQKPNL